MNTIALFFIGSYAIICLVLLYTWQSMAEENKQLELAELPLFITIIIPIRNEAENIVNILQDIENQIYNKINFELIIVNDASTDNSIELITTYKRSSDLNLKIINLQAINNNFSPKKRAITAAIKAAKGELVVTTDGDCRVGEYWLSSIASYYEKSRAYFISSPVTFLDNQKATFFEKTINALQIIEFGSLIGSAGCSIKMRSPTMCSGANLAYKKEAFLAVNGFAGNEHIASGDDEFLMHKIANQFPGKVHFLKNKKSIVQTSAHTTFQSFYHQRKRWASKWRFYTNWQPTALAVLIALINLATVWAILTLNWQLIGLKFLLEFVFLLQLMKFFNKEWTIPYIFLTQFIYPFYVLLFAIVAQFKTEYKWKERKLK